MKENLNQMKQTLSFCNAFIQNALRDPYTNEIGKTLVFCVSQKHAVKLQKF